MSLQDTAWIGAAICALALVVTRYSGMLDKREVKQA